MSRYRRLRGISRHVLPVIRTRLPQGRQLLAPPKRFAVATYRPGYCVWCQLPLREYRARKWHKECKFQFLSCIGYVVPPQGDKICANCGVAQWDTAHLLEIDHKYPIHHAKAAGIKPLVRAFLLENIQWLCAPCHRTKTAADAAASADARQAKKPQPVKKRRLQPWELMSPLFATEEDGDDGEPEDVT